MRQSKEIIKSSVSDEPQVEVKMASPASSSSTRAVVKQGDEITLQCIVKRSNPQPHAYAWLKDGATIDGEQKDFVELIKPENNGTYSCRATNTVGTGTSELHITVECKFHSSLCCVCVREYREKEINPQTVSP